MSPRPRTVRSATALAAVLLVSGCSHYHIGIPLVPGLSLGLGASKDGNYSVGLNTGFGPLGAGVAMHNTGMMSGSAGVGVGVGVGPVGTGVGVGKTVVLHDPNAAPGTPPVVLPTATTVSATASPVTAPATQPAPVRVTYRTPAVAAAAASASSSRELGTPANPIAP